MKLSRLALVLPLVGIAAWVGSSLLRSDRSTPAETIARTRDRFENTDTDGRVLIRELDRIREDPRTLGDEQALTDLLLLRSEIFESVGDIASARNDVERVLTLYRQDDTALALRAAELEAAEGRVEDALARAMRLARRPGQAPEVWRTIGKLERLQAQEQLTTALRSVDEVLVGESAARVKSTLQELAARDPADRARRTLSDEVRAGLPGGELDLIKQVLDAAEVASVHNRSARAALANALGAGADVASARRMVELLHQAGRSELAADLAFAARLHPEIWKDEAVFEIALDVEVALGHLDNAAQMIKAWDWENRDPSAALCEKALQLLLAADDPKAMGGPMNVLRRMQSSSTTQIALFYQALQTARRATESGETNQFASALKRWTDFLGAGDNLDPVPGGQALAFIERSKAKRALGNSQGELEDLLRALTPPLSAARDVWLSRVSADDYMRMADLSSDARNSGYRGPEERWTQAMSLAPERWQELFPRWAELGGLSLQRDSGYSFEEVMKSARGNRRSIPVMNVGPNTLFRVARGHLTDGKFEGALSVARQLLAEYPGLVPAWDVMIEAQLARGSRVQVVVDLINRLSLTGADAQATSYLSQVGEDALRPPQRLEWMRLDPAGMGARVLAQHALDRGQPLRALRALGSPPDERSAEPFDLRLVRTEALLELGLADQALATVAGLQQHPVVGNRALALQLVALLETGGDLTDVVGRLVERLSGDEPPLRQGLDAVDLLLTRGHTDLAGDLLSALDSRRETRSGAVLERMTLHGLLVGDRDEALDALARAEAFFEDGRVELRRLIVGIENRDWRQLPTLAVGARAALGDQVDPWLGAALLLIEERHSAGLEAAQAGLQNDPRSPQWALLHAVATDLSDLPVVLPACVGDGAREATAAALRGNTAVGRDPRELLGAVIAIEFAGWAPSAATACQAMRERGGGELWPAWFEARALERQGRAPEAHEAYASLTGAFPAFGPGWDGLERSLVAQHGPGWSAERMQLRASRSEAKGGQAASEVDLAIDDACARMLLGERREAIADLEATLEAAKGANRSAQLLLAELHLRGAGVGRATGALRAALPTSRRLTDDPVVGLLVNNLLQEALRELEQGTTSNLARTERDLARLIESYPSDPLPVLAWSRLRAEAEDRNPALVVDVITKAFEALRDRTAGQPLASLRSDAAQEWGSFLLTIAPDVAETFLLEDLAVTPGDLDLWRLLAQAIAAQDRPEDATDLYEAIVTMSSDPLAHEAYAWFLLERGASADKVQEHLKRASILAADEPIDALRSKFVAALAQLRLSEDPKISGLINSFSQLWERRGDLTGVSTQRLGRAYITALIQRREGKDRRTIQAVLAELTRGSELDPYVADLARAMAGIERHLPDVSAEEEDRRRKRSSDDDEPGRSQRDRDGDGADPEGPPTEDPEGVDGAGEASQAGRKKPGRKGQEREQGGGNPNRKTPRNNRRSQDDEAEQPAQRPNRRAKPMTPEERRAALEEAQRKAEEGEAADPGEAGGEEAGGEEAGGEEAGGEEGGGEEGGGEEGGGEEAGGEEAGGGQ